MNEGVLPWEGKTFGSDSEIFKDCPIAVESFESICQLYQRVLSVTEFQKCMKHLQNIPWDISFDCRKVYLSVVMQFKLYQSNNNHDITFISALESLPVHCLNPWPWGKHRSPEKGGAAAILTSQISTGPKIFGRVILFINIIKDLVHPCLAMGINDIFAHPGNKVIFKGPFDELME